MSDVIETEFNRRKDDDLEDRIQAIEVDKRVHDGINKWVRTVCITATTSLLSAFYWLGSVVYNQSTAFEAAIKAFWIAAKKGSGHD